VKTLKFEYKNHRGSTKIREVEPQRIFFGTTPHITEQEWLLEGRDVEKNENRCFVLKDIQRMIDEEVQRFLCVTVYVVNQENKFLMLLNRKLNKWVPAGGKVDRNETPDDAAVRECFEETGINIKLCGPKTPVDGGLFCPYGVQLNTIKPQVRDHVDLIYLGCPEEGQELKRSEREASDIGWFSLDEVKKLDTFTSVVQWCEFFHRSRNKALDY
jgi:8-oxo-dGTP pyrophosphatase MutT (NUDIX family)